MTRDDTTGMLILMNEDALSLATGTMEVPPGARLIVAGQSLVQTTLAELQLPGAQMIWTDFRQSASLSALHSTVQAAGGAGPIGSRRRRYQKLGHVFPYVRGVDLSSCAGAQEKRCDRAGGRGGSSGALA